MMFSLLSNTTCTQETFVTNLGTFVKYWIISNPAKCMLGVNKFQFLGHHVTQHGVSPLPEQVRVIKEFPQPCPLQQRQEFLGLVNFYHRFIPHCTTILTPLNPLLKSTATNSHTLQWNPNATSAF